MKGHDGMGWTGMTMSKIKQGMYRCWRSRRPSSRRYGDMVLMFFYIYYDGNIVKAEAEGRKWRDRNRWDFRDREILCECVLVLLRPSTYMTTEQQWEKPELGMNECDILLGIHLEGSVNAAWMRYSLEVWRRLFAYCQGRISSKYGRQARIKRIRVKSRRPVIGR